jgi:hypothetical protein
MNRFQPVWSAALAASALLFAARAQATVIDFDELAETPNGIQIPNGYGGFNWNNFYELDGITASSSGYLPGTVSQPNVAFNWFANPASLSLANGGQFNFSGAYLTAAWNDGLQVGVQGFRRNSLVYDMTVSPSATSPAFFPFNYQNIDSLAFNSFGGSHHDGYRLFGAQFVMDNFTYTLAPEPSSIALAIIAGLAAAAALYGGRKNRATLARYTRAPASVGVN